MADVALKYFHDFQWKADTISGCVESKEALNEFINELKCKGIAFFVRSSKSSTTKKNNSKIKKIWFDKATGYPYYIEKYTLSKCVHGKQYRYKKPEPVQQDHPTGKRKRRRITSTKKLGCEASMTVKELCILNNEEFKEAYTMSQRKRNQISANLRHRMNAGESLSSFTRILVEFSIAHSHPTTYQKIDIHPDIKNEIRDMIAKGLISVRKPNVHLKDVSMPSDQDVNNMDGAEGNNVDASDISLVEFEQIEIVGEMTEGYNFVADHPNDETDVGLLVEVGECPQDENESVLKKSQMAFRQVLQELIDLSYNTTNAEEICFLTSMLQGEVLERIKKTIPHQTT